MEGVPGAYLIQHDDVFDRPGDDTQLWRYMDFTKLVALLEDQALYFPSAAQLSDPFEGSTSEANVEQRASFYKDFPLAVDSNVQREAQQLAEWMRKVMFISCWFASEYESAAMWTGYVKSGDGVAITTTAGRLVQSLATYNKTVELSYVKYIDYKKDWMPEGNGYFPFVHKRKSFEHEREVRALIWRSDLGQANAPTPPGISVPISLPTLIQEVFVAPTASTWFKPLIESLLRRYELKVPVQQSDLSRTSAVY